MTALRHHLELDAEKRVQCTICHWSWAGGKSSIKSACPGVPRYGGYERAAKAGLKTYTMLRKVGLKTDWSKPAGCIYIQGRREWVWLYDERQTTPRRRASEAQKAVLARGRATAIRNITCQDCGHIASGKEERSFIRRHSCCENCWWEQQIRHDHNVAIRDAQRLLASEVLILDTETTGLGLQDTVIEVAIINTASETLFHSLIYPESPISPEAQATHGISATELEQAPRFAEVWPQVQALIAQRPFASYNSDFDTRLLSQTARRAGVTLPEGWADKAACLMGLYAAYRGELRSEGEYRWVSLTAACHEQQIQPGHHSALGDAHAALALLKALASKQEIPDPDKSATREENA